ncbi:MAG: hypothetical protein JST93_11155 [Acidobacteria bacterium]|nr:hypothetical protein [Acidobacteriota bacterium]
MVRVIAPARLHFGLMGVSEVIGRSFGGVGLMVDGYNTEIRAAPSIGDSVPTFTGYSTEESAQVLAGLYRLWGKPLPLGAQFDRSRGPNRHSGFGSKTSVLLATMTAYSELVYQNLGTPRPSEYELKWSSGRGGASGVGIHGFFNGGLVADAGHRGVQEFRPSSSRQWRGVPTAIATLQFPSQWKILVVEPPGLQISGDTELGVFQGMNAVDETTIRKQVTAIYGGIVPGVLEQDFGAFSSAMKLYQSLGLKAHEVMSQSEVVRETIRMLSVHSPCVGMSSLGPAVFAIFESDPSPEVSRLGSVVSSSSTGVRVSNDG